ncbi:MAG TPA: hypothetical protein ENK31_03090, partial [Nannocystis exedens]|nr:hypothetical protein [Nannocystis exedens]
MNNDDRSLDPCFDELLAEAQASIKAEIADELALIKPDFPALLAEIQRTGVDIDGATAETDEGGSRGRRDSLVLLAEDGKGPARSTKSGTAFRLLEDEKHDGQSEPSNTDLGAAYGGLLGEYSTSDDPLAALTADARLEIEADIAARHLLPIPEFPSPAGTQQAAESSSVQNREPRLRWLGAAMAIAAATLLIWGFGPALARPLLGGPTGSQA